MARPPSSPTQTKAPSVPPLPTKLGHYAVGAKIGGGGMASVYLGRTTKNGAEELVALKVIKEELLEDANFSDMFLDEAKILSRLSHEHVIRTLEYGVSGRRHFIAMELLLGRTLADVWDPLAKDGKRLPLNLAAWICARVAEGLHSAHELADENGTPLLVVHRDVNPTNIFLTYDGRVKLIDFGLAKARKRASKKSLAGVVKGKIPYLAPEQTHMKPIDRRVDIFSLGTTLWEVGTGRRLFKRDTDFATLQAVREGNIPDPRTFHPDFPEALFRITSKALQYDPKDRYQTADAMRRDLDAYLAGAAPNDMSTELARTLNDLFPGELERQHTWLNQAASRDRQPPAKTMRPPVPVPANADDDPNDDTNTLSSLLPGAAKRASLPPSPPRYRWAVIAATVLVVALLFLLLSKR